MNDKSYGATKKVNLGSIEASALIFQSPFHNEHQYIVGRDNMDFIEFMKRYPNAKRATGLQMDDYSDKFWLVFVADCFDPPCAIVRADTPCVAEEIFVDELPWSHIEEPDLKDYLDEKTGEHTCGFGPGGQPYDWEQTMVHGIKLIRVEID